MNDFTYHNIFETKGIEYILTIVFFILLVPFWMLLNRRIRVRKNLLQMKSILESVLATIPKGIYITRNHTWAFLEKSGVAKIGWDYFVIHLTGQVQLHYLKEIGGSIRRGEVLVEVFKDGKTLQVLAPLSGRLTAINTNLKVDPDLLSLDPYGKGWMFEIEPMNWGEETQSFYMAGKAMYWLQTEILRLKNFLNVAAQKLEPEYEKLVLQDGGELIDQVLAELPKEVWNEFQEEFLNHKD